MGLNVDEKLLSSYPVRCPMIACNQTIREEIGEGYVTMTVISPRLDLVHEDETMVGYAGACPRCGGEITLSYNKESQ